jgi:hypothetical protein
MVGLEYAFDGTGYAPGAKNRFWNKPADGRRVCVAFSRARDALFVVVDRKGAFEGAKTGKAEHLADGKEAKYVDHLSKWLNLTLQSTIKVDENTPAGRRQAIKEFEDRLEGWKNPPDGE